MIIYNVTVNVDFDIAAEWLQWMTEKHIPDVMATGMFFDYHIYRVLAEEDSGLTYAIQYLCEDMATLEVYRETFAPALQADALARFGDKFVAFRTLLEVIR